MKKVHVLIRVDCDNEVWGIFSTKKKANEYKKEIEQENKPFKGRWRVEPWVIDEVAQ